MKKTLTIVIILTNLLISTLGCAETRYFGLGIGQSKLEEDYSSGPNPFISVSAGDTSLRIFTGLSLSRHFDMEFGYLDLGEVYSERVSFIGYPPHDSSVLTINGFYVNGLARMPLSKKVTLVAQGGLFAWSAKAEYVYYGSPTYREDDSAFDNDIDYSYGVGLNLGITNSIELALMYEKFNISNIEDNAFYDPVEYDAKTSLTYAAFKYKF